MMRPELERLVMAAAGDSEEEEGRRRPGKRALADLAAPGVAPLEQSQAGHLLESDCVASS
jgi:hypothetical protein